MVEIILYFNTTATSSKYKAAHLDFKYCVVKSFLYYLLFLEITGDRLLNILVCQNLTIMVKADILNRFSFNSGISKTGIFLQNISVCINQCFSCSVVQINTHTHMHASGLAFTYYNQRLKMRLNLWLLEISTKIRGKERRPCASVLSTFWNCTEFADGTEVKKPGSDTAPAQYFLLSGLPQNTAKNR